ncbi:MAG: hypothetical protein WCL61_03765 [bacterium]
MLVIFLASFVIPSFFAKAMGSYYYQINNFPSHSGWLFATCPWCTEGYLITLAFFLSLFFPLATFRFWYIVYIILIGIIILLSSIGAYPLIFWVLCLAVIGFILGHIFKFLYSRYLSK